MDLRDAYDLAQKLLAEHGLHGWTAGFDRAKRRAGICRHQEQQIGLSAALTRLHDDAEVRETILHEIAHALAGPEHQHDDVWRGIARSIGSTGDRCVPEDAPRVKGDWLGVCAAGHESDRHRRPERVLLCAKCEGRAPVDRVFEWTHRGRPAPMHPNYQAELEAVIAGQRMRRHAPGQRVRIVSEGPWGGKTGVIERVGRTRYGVRVPEGVVNVLFAAVEPMEGESRGPSEPSRLAGDRQVSLSLLTPDGRFHVQNTRGEVAEMWIHDEKRLRDILLDDSTQLWASVGEEPLLRHQFLLDRRPRGFSMMLKTASPAAPHDATLEIRSCRSEWGDSDWVDVDEYIADLFRAAVRRRCHLLLQTADRSLNVRLDCRGQFLFVAADREITAHDVWRGAKRHGQLHVLQSPVSDSAVGAAGKLAMVAFGSNAVHPLQVFPSFVQDE